MMLGTLCGARGRLVLFSSLLLFMTVLVSSSMSPLVLAQQANPVQIVQRPTSGYWSSGISFNVVLPRSPTSGDVLICTFGSTDPNGTVSVSSIADANGQTTWTREVWNIYHEAYDFDCEIWCGRVNSAGASKTITITLSNADPLMYASGSYVSEYSGLASSNPLDKTATNEGIGSSSDSGTTMITTQADELWIAAIVGSAPQSNPTNGFTLTHLVGIACDLGNFEKMVNTTGYANTGASMGPLLHDYTGCIATFLASTSPATRPVFTISNFSLIALTVFFSLAIAAGTVGLVIMHLPDIWKKEKDLS